MKNVRILAGIFCLVCINLAVAGSIKGQVKLTAAEVAGDAVVYVEEIEGKTFEPPAEPVVMDQKNLTFIPHVLPVLVGTKVGFRNSDDILHNVFTPSKVGDMFNLGTYGKGVTRYHTFEKLGAAVILCDIHPEMEAWVVVLPTPYFAKTDDKGNYEISDVPAGGYKLNVWYEKTKNAKPLEVSVTVPKSGEEEADITLEK